MCSWILFLSDKVGIRICEIYYVHCSSSKDDKCSLERIEMGPSLYQTVRLSHLDPICYPTHLIGPTQYLKGLHRYLGPPRIPLWTLPAFNCTEIWIPFILSDSSRLCLLFYFSLSLWMNVSKDSPTQGSFSIPRPRSFASTGLTYVW
jgi:hypothetical protein